MHAFSIEVPLGDFVSALGADLSGVCDKNYEDADRDSND
jgi:hypothetical protein